MQNLPLESSCVVLALIENYSTAKSLKVSPEKSQILSCDTLVANERYIYIYIYIYIYKSQLVPVHTMMYIGSRSILHSILTSVLDGRERLASRTRHFTPGKSPAGIHLI